MIPSLFAEDRVSGAAEIHVSAAGDDRHPGSIQSPVATIQRAVDLAERLDGPAEIIIQAGSYSGSVVVRKRKGEQRGPAPTLTIRAAREPDGTYADVVIVGSVEVKGAEPYEHMPGVYQAEMRLPAGRIPYVWEAETRRRYTQVADPAAVHAYPSSFCFADGRIVCRTSDDREPSDVGLRAASQSQGIRVWRSDVTILGLHFRGFLTRRWSSGVSLDASRITVEDCHASNCTVGFRVSERVAATRIRRCAATDVATGVLSLGDNTIVEQCRLEKVRDSFKVPCTAEEDCGIKLYYPGREIVVRGNLVSGFAHAIFTKSNPSNYTIENNTCVNNSRRGIGGNNWAGRYIVRNNLVSGTLEPIKCLPHQANQLANDVIEQNCFWYPDRMDELRKGLRVFQKSGKGQDTVLADPQFADPDQGDFRLRSGSPCISQETGERVIGALELAGGSPQFLPAIRLKMGLRAPAKLAAVPVIYYKRDRWLGDAHSPAREMIFRGRDSEWVSPTSSVTLDIQMVGGNETAARMRFRVNGGKWSSPEPFRNQRTLKLPDKQRYAVIDMQAGDDRGNWGDIVSAWVGFHRVAPKMIGKPVFITNRNGVVVLFDTDVPCRVTMEFGLTEQYGKLVDAGRVRQIQWVDQRGKDRAKARRRARNRNRIVLVRPEVQPGKSYHGRLMLEGPFGHRVNSANFQFTVEGETRTVFVSPSGYNAGRGGRRRPWRTIQYACDRVLPGDRITLLPGLYTGSADWTHGGLSDAPITLRSQVPGGAILDGHWAVDQCLKLNNAPHVVLDGIEIRWYRRRGIMVNQSKQVEVRNCIIWNRPWSHSLDGFAIKVEKSPRFRATQNQIFRTMYGIFLFDSPHSRLTYNTATLCWTPVIIKRSTNGTICRNNCLAYNYMGKPANCGRIAGQPELRLQQPGHAIQKSHRSGTAGPAGFGTDRRAATEFEPARKTPAGAQ